MQFTSRLVLTLLSIVILIGGMGFLLKPDNNHIEQIIINDTRPLQVHLIRIVGYSIGNDIQGHFQLSVNGPANLTHVTIHINQTLAHNTTHHQFTWAFHTDNYPLGWTNISVQGYDVYDTVYEWSILKRFVSSDVNTPYWIAALLFGIIFTIIIVAAKAQQLRHKTKS